MKFIISENKLEEVKLKVLQLKIDQLNSYLKDKRAGSFDTFIVIWGDDEDFDGNRDVLFEYDYFDGRLYVSENVRNTFTGFFGDDKEKSDAFFKHWFENKFDVDVAFLD